MKIKLNKQPNKACKNRYICYTGFTENLHLLVIRIVKSAK